MTHHFTKPLTAGGLLLSGVCCSSYGNEITPYGDALIRYEFGTDYRQLKTRERVRFIGHLGVKYQLDPSWFFDARLSTGVKNQQNVPAITLIRLNRQSLPEKDVYFDRFYSGFSINGVEGKIGKLPWSLKRNTDMFWDTDLHPYGMHLKYQLDPDSKVEGGVIKPLDGNSLGVGLLSYLSYSRRFNVGGLRWEVSPWFADYRGKSGAQFAVRDTELDNRSLRLAVSLSWDKFKLGLDAGRALNDFSNMASYRDQKNAWSLLLQHGGLKKPGDSLAQIRLMRIERFGVIAEFAQNGVSRFATSNYEAVELRYRYRLTDNWWMGARYDYSRTLLGTQEQGKRIRLEAKYEF